MPQELIKLRKGQEYKLITLFCLQCSKELKLNNNRDIKRKKFCSHSCQIRYNHLNNPNMSNPPIPTKNTRIKAGLKIRGEKHFKWIKDRTQLKKKRFNCSDRETLFALRNDVFKRDNYTCQITNIKGGKLNMHHLNNWADFPEQRTNIDNCITLNVEIHKRFHKIFGNRNNTKEQFEVFKKMVM